LPIMPRIPRVGARPSIASMAPLPSRRCSEGESQFRSAAIRRVLPDTNGEGSVFLREEKRCRAAIPLGNHPQLFLSSRLIGGKEAGAVFKRPLIFPDVLVRQLTPIAVFVPHEKLQGHLPRYAKGLVRTRGHHELAQLELAGLLELLHQELQTGFQDGEAAWTRTPLIELAGAVVSGQEVLIARPLRFVFARRHKMMQLRRGFGPLLEHSILLLRRHRLGEPLARSVVPFHPRPDLSRRRPPCVEQPQHVLGHDGRFAGGQN
jgi:hypothetical protein